MLPFFFGAITANYPLPPPAPGVGASLRGRIFEPFFTTKDVGEGTGLGLAVSRQLIEAVGGELLLLPSGEGPGTGACFELRLPVAAGDEDEVATVRAPREAWGA